jgi:hypothetical protein
MTKGTAIEKKYKSGIDEALTLGQTENIRLSKNQSIDLTIYI